MKSTEWNGMNSVTRWLIDFKYLAIYDCENLPKALHFAKVGSKFFQKLN